MRLATKPRHRSLTVSSHLISVNQSSPFVHVSVIKIGRERKRKDRDARRNANEMRSEMTRTRDEMREMICNTTCKKKGTKLVCRDFRWLCFAYVCVWRNFNLILPQNFTTKHNAESHQLRFREMKPRAPFGFSPPPLLPQRRTNWPCDAQPPMCAPRKGGQCFFYLTEIHLQSLLATKREETKEKKEIRKRKEIKNQRGERERKEHIFSRTKSTECNF